MVGVGALVLSFSSAWLPPSVASSPTRIYIVQGLPGRTVAVSVDGKLVARDLAGGEVSGPIAVKRGTRTVTVAEGDETLVTSKVSLPLGSNSEIVVHLPASPTGDPMITRFDNKLEDVQSGRAAQSVAHVAAAGPIDIRINKQVVSANVANGEFTYKVIPAGTRSVDIVQAGMSEPLLGPFDNTLAAGKMTWLFAIGEPGKDLDVVRHVIALSESKDSERPADVRTGTGGQAAELATFR